MPSCGAQNLFRLGAPTNFDRCAILASLHHPPGALRRRCPARACRALKLIYTNEKEKALVVAFADCTPLLFYDPVKNVISNVHSGWKGTVQMIGKKAVEKMTKDYGCNPENIICCIGPTIRKCHFEVQDDVKEIFYNKFKEIIDIEKYILPKEKKNKEEVNKYYIDTVSINKEILLKAGLKEENIVDSKICTVCNNEKIHSYRAHGKESGRNITIMELN